MDKPSYSGHEINIEFLKRGLYGLGKNLYFLLSIILYFQNEKEKNKWLHLGEIFFYRNRVELTHSMEYVTLCGKMTEFSRSNMSWKNVYPPAWVIDKLLSALSDSWVEGEVDL